MQSSSALRSFASVSLTRVITSSLCLGTVTRWLRPQKMVSLSRMTSFSFRYWVAPFSASWIFITKSGENIYTDKYQYKWQASLWHIFRTLKHPFTLLKSYTGVNSGTRILASTLAYFKSFWMLSPILHTYSSYDSLKILGTFFKAMLRYCTKPISDMKSALSCHE